VDITSLITPFYILNTTAHLSHITYNDKQLSSYATLLSAIFLSLPIYYISAKYLPVLLVTHFEGLRNLYPLPISLLIAINLPAGYALDTILTRYGRKGALVALANVIVTVSGRMYLGLDVDIEGVGIILGLWVGSILVSISATYIFILSG